MDARRPDLVWRGYLGKVRMRRYQRDDGRVPWWVIAALVAVLLAAAIGYHILNYEAYKQRFPNAEPWTYWFGGVR